NFDKEVDFVLTDVPYWLMDKVEKSKGTYKKVGEPAKGVFSDKSKLKPFNNKTPKTKQKWKLLLHNVFSECYRVLKTEKYCAVFIGNMYYKKRYHLLTAELTSILEKIGFVLKGEIIWYDVAKKLHLYGINYSWIPSIVHQFILIFRKPKPENA
ncbi:MAG: DNA methyltransferase, partial [Candidatus Helarchaeota archaeon]